MPSDAAAGPRPGATLGFDTSGGWVRTALVRDGRLLAARDLPMARGQGEALLPALEDTLAEAGLDWADLAAIGVGIGPGNFTGIRLSTAAARGLALGLAIPAIGIDRFEALALDGPALPVAVPALRGQLWTRAPGAAPALTDTAPAAAIGEAPGLTQPAHPLAVAIARLAETRRATPQPRPAPLYLREPDAAPPSVPPPALID